MGRLTKEFEFGLGHTECYEACGMCLTVECGSFCTGLQEMLKKLAHYEELEEQGRLIELPCAIGDTVWRLHSGEIKECKVSMLQQKVDKSWKVRISYPFNHRDDKKLDDLGNTWFLTKEEALAKLKELEEGGTDD